MPIFWIQVKDLKELVMLADVIYVVWLKKKSTQRKDT